MSACSVGVAKAKYWKGCGLSMKHGHLEAGTASWSCDFRSAGLASAVACDGEQNYFVSTGAGENQRA